MSWQNLEGHDPIVERFRHAIARGRFGSAFLFVGSEGVGKRSFAIALAKGLFCTRADESELNPCGRCASCVQIDAGTHPDLLQVAKPSERSYLPVELIIGDRDHRMRRGLIHDIGLKPFRGRRKMAIIDDADYLNAEGANAMLKTLEEPPPGSVLILIGTSTSRQLPTIRSRCQLVRFGRLDESVIANILLNEGLTDDPAMAAAWAAASEGSPVVARQLADEQLSQFQETLWQMLAAVATESVELGQSVSQFVDNAGKEAPVRRARLRQVVRSAIDYYRQSIEAVWRDESVDRSLDRCLDALTQIDRNANQTTLIECWADDLAAIAMK
jgi:DNA polymerase III subunit delta'